MLYYTKKTNQYKFCSNERKLEEIEELIEKKRMKKPAFGGPNPPKGEYRQGMHKVIKGSYVEVILEAKLNPRLKGYLERVGVGFFIASGLG